jgi:peptidoglycan glycosyltransferase
MGRRIRWLGVVLLLCFALVIVQLANIQFRRASALANSPQNPIVHAKIYDNNRGEIFASDGTLLAKSVKITSQPGHYQYEREYPTATAQLYAGITGYDSIFYGTSGIEYEYNQYLQTHPQAPKNLSQILFNKPPSVPDDVTLTVDPVLQQAAQSALAALPGPNKDGAVVVLNPTTGAVLAMVSSPTFDPNGYANPSVSAEQAYNFGENVKDHEGFTGTTPLATQKPIPPGSTFKVVVSTAVYNLKPSLISYSFPSAVSVSFPDGFAIHNDSGACGGTMALMLPQSCDPGYAELGVQLGVPTLTQQAQLFGFSVFGAASQYVPKLDLPNVSPSTISNLTPNSQALLGQSSIGQYNDAATALQNAMVAAGIANGGIIMTPHLLEQVRDAQGNVVLSYNPTPMLRASSQTAAASVNALMQKVANNTVPNATANGIFPASWDVAVKTGTAQDPHGGTEHTDDWMIGFLPAHGTPKIAIAVVVPYQAQSATGAAISGPIVKKVLQAYLTETGAQG